MTQQAISPEAKAGTLGGTITSLLLNIGGDVAKTAILTATGAVVSFAVSLVLQYLFRKWKEVMCRSGNS